MHLHDELASCALQPQADVAARGNVLSSKKYAYGVVLTLARLGTFQVLKQLFLSVLDVLLDRLVREALAAELAQLAPLRSAVIEALRVEQLAGEGKRAQKLR